MRQTELYDLIFEKLDSDLSNLQTYYNSFVPATIGPKSFNQVANVAIELLKMKS